MKGENHTIVLSSIWLYPVKGLRGHTVGEAMVAPRGLVGDRRCMVVDESGRFMTQRQHPQMVRTSARWLGGAIELAHEGESVRGRTDAAGTSRSVQVWASTVTALELPWGSRFLSAALGMTCHLVALPESETRSVTSTSAHQGDQVSFADAFPYLLTSASSLDDLAARAGVPLTMERFRPNLVSSGLAPWAEDDISAITIGEVGFQSRKRCDRCSVTLIDPDTAASGKEPLRTLATFRERDGKVYFGINLVARGPGLVRVGDAMALAPSAATR